LAIQALNLSAKFLPLAISLGFLGLWTIRAANETKVRFCLGREWDGFDRWPLPVLVLT
jgi:hypothetical protein